MKKVTWMICALLLVGSTAAQSGPPVLCKPCLFYGGDFDGTDPNAAAYPDENTGTYPQTSTYGTVSIPPGHSVLIEGILFQITFSPIVKLDPNGATWEIRSEVSEGNGGTLVASGQGPVVMQPTGRAGNGPEYTVAIKVKPPVFLTGNTFYSFNITPPCVGKHDQECAVIEYSATNTTNRANSYRGIMQPAHDIYVNSKAYDLDWANWCEFDNQEQCAYLSFGLMGKIVQ